MTLPLSVSMIRGCYDFLVETPPFSRWNLPAAEDLDITVSIDKGHHGWLTTKRGKRPRLTISTAAVGHTSTLVMTVAHEMIHVHQWQSKMPLTHGEAFNRLKKQVCRYHGFDPKLL